MDSFPRIIEHLARLIDYPTADLGPLLDESAEILSACHPDLRAGVDEFGRRAATHTLAELEEIYIQTFDMNPTCTLDLGWQLFGEDYNRGLFLVKVRQLMSRLGIPETHELPDHLTNILRVLSRMEPSEARLFARSCVLPALQKTSDAVNSNCPYRPLMTAVLNLLLSQYAEVPKETPDGALV